MFPNGGSIVVTSQKLVLVVLLLLVSGSVLFPPWIEVYDTRGTRGYSEETLGYHFIGVTPSGPGKSMYHSVKIDITKLSVQLIGSILICGVLYALAGGGQGRTVPKE
jgi:hypothetical protein